MTDTINGTIRYTHEQIKSFLLKCIVNGEALNNRAGLCLDLIRLMFELVLSMLKVLCVMFYRNVW